jgi:hypothetical protein
VLQVTTDGHISQVAAFGNVVPTGLDVSADVAYVAQAGPVPHNPEDAKVVAVQLPSGTTEEVASGASGDIAGLTVDVESRGRTLYALLQGDWTLPIAPENEGMPASPDTGALVKVERDGAFTTVVNGLDRPTSLEFIGDTAFVVTLTGTVIKIAGAAHPTHD